MKYVLITFALCATMCTDAASPTWSIKTGVFSSPDGRYEVSVLPSETPEAKYPSSPFVLTDKKTGKELWRRTDKVCLAGFFVRNDGTVWVDDWDYIYGVDLGGKIITETQQEWRARFPERYHCRTSHGTWWSWSLSFRYFLEHNDKPYFCVRPWWDQRLLIDLQAGRYVEANGSITNALLEAERDWVLDTLADGTNRIWEIESNQCPHYDRDWIKAAIRVAGASAITNAIPLLRKYEEVEIQGSNDMRALAQISLRRLGAQPKDLPVFTGKLRWNSETLTVGPHTNKLSREARARLLRPGMTARQALDAIASPDYVRDYPPLQWEFDVDTAPPSTCRIAWTNDVIESVEILNPPTWTDGETRDYHWLEEKR